MMNDKTYMERIALLKSLLHSGDYKEAAKVAEVTPTTVRNALAQTSLRDLTIKESKCIQALADIALRRKQERQALGEAIAGIKQ